MDDIRRKLEPVTESLESVSKASEEIAKAASGGEQGTRVVVADASVLIAIATTAPAILANAGFIFLIAFLVLAERRALRRAVIRLGGTLSFRRRLAETMRDLHRNVARYLFTVTCINVGLGLATAGAMVLLGMPSPAIWGVANAALNFVPYLGPIAVMVMAGAVGLVTFPEPLTAVYPVAALVALNIVESQFVTPYLLARRWQMSPLAVVVAVTAGAALWDIAGAIVAAPMLVVLTTIAQHILDGRVTRRVLPQAPVPPPKG
jgi:predicted PurR-regulated permease PerM